MQELAAIERCRLVHIVDVILVSEVLHHKIQEPCSVYTARDCDVNTLSQTWVVQMHWYRTKANTQYKHARLGGISQQVKPGTAIAVHWA